MKDDELLEALRRLQRRLQSEKLARYRRRVAWGDLLTERADNASEYGFGEGTTCYDGVLVLGDVRVGRSCWIGPNVVLDGTGGLEIGDYCSISAGVQVYTHDTVAWSSSLGRAPRRVAPTKIGAGVYLGPNTVVSMGSTIGDRCVIGAMSLVRGTIPAGSRAWGCPARVMGPTSEGPASGDA